MHLFFPGVPSKPGTPNIDLTSAVAGKASGQPKQQPGQQPQPPQQQASAGGASGAQAGETGGMMDVGSKAGYYTSKSPKLHLLEWTQRSGFERPKYKINDKQEEDGSVTCRVFINHPKRKEDGVMVVLDRKHAAPDPQEAEQRAALAALEQVAGSCNYHMLLPKQYLGLWKELGQASAQRKEKEAARLAAEERQQQREKARDVKEAHCAPQKVVMSKENQAALQALVQERFALRAQMAAIGKSMGPGS
ncbi:hypothetical protein DUNSADRAFT_7462, partial [Dunaliella salina]